MKISHDQPPVSVRMECPVCFECAPAHTLVCGHSICKQCVKDWYIKNEGATCTCPMCRRNLYFRGMGDSVAQWEEDRVESHYSAIFNNLFDDIFEDIAECEDDEEREFILEELAEMQTNFNKIRNSAEYLYDEEDMYTLLMDPEVEVILSKEKNESYYESATFNEYLFVPKRTAGVVASRTGRRFSADHTPWPTFELVLVF